ncbi:transcription termination factor 5, mitochondrial isoform X2 [Diachasmimorpha longicaudata]|uniref:transcription termination factor 5, mitochondrial isoform X2 n=1 Tax=Diachasmimorpha longicaudata TaxID=58733 RepID=UPI0030B91C13
MRKGLLIIVVYAGQKENVDLQDSINDLKFLEFSEDDLENRILLLKEMGAQYISTAMLKLCASRIHVVTFKAYTKIPDDVVISEKLCSHLHAPPSDVPALVDLNELMTVKEYRKQCLAHWLKWRLEIPDTGHKLIETMTKALRYKSFSRLRQCFDILHNELGISVQLIREKKYLSRISSSNLRKILTDIPEICGVSTKQLLKNHPSLLKMKYQNVFHVKEQLEDLGITAEQVLNVPQILMANSASVDIGVETIKTTPELKILIHHPNLLQILLTKDGIQQRIAYLRYLRVNGITVSTLGRSKTNFDRFLRSGVHRMKGEEIAVLLKKYLNKNTDEIQEGIKKHPLWKHVDLVTIQDTLMYLMEYFDVDDIFKNIQLLLYSRDKIEYPLSSLMTVNQQMQESNRFTPSQLLALCAYQIEREYHFTGDSVWDRNDSPSKKTPEELSRETDEWRHNQTKHPLNDEVATPVPGWVDGVCGVDGEIRWIIQDTCQFVDEQHGTDGSSLLNSTEGSMNDNNRQELPRIGPIKLPPFPFCIRL